MKISGEFRTRSLVPMRILKKVMALGAVPILAVVTVPAFAAGSIANLPAVPAKMDCTLGAFQSLNLNGAADDNGQVTFTAVSLVAASATNPAVYCSVRGVIGPGASSIGCSGAARLI